MQLNGIALASTELLLFFIPIFIFKKYQKHLPYMNNIVYFWLSFTILTGFWEFFFITNYKKTRENSILLLTNKTHVWTNKYDITYLLPWKFSEIFYSEYGAYADKLYMSPKGIWSRIIESTHALFCGLFAFLSLYYYYYNKQMLSNKFVLMTGVAMGCQLMNSLLYMGEYFIETTNKNSLNYNSNKFPTGFLLLKRPFMWINLFWTIMPVFVLIYIYIRIKNI